MHIKQKTLTCNFVQDLFHSRNKNPLWSKIFEYSGHATSKLSVTMLHTNVHEECWNLTLLSTKTTIFQQSITKGTTTSIHLLQHIDLWGISKLCFSLKPEILRQLWLSNWVKLFQCKISVNIYYGHYSNESRQMQ